LLLHDILLQLNEYLPAGLTRLIELGGPVVVILLAISVLALAAILLKLWQFAVAGVGARHFAERALHHWFAGRSMEALRAVVNHRRSPLAKVLTAAMHGLSQNPASEPRIREEVQRIAAVELEQLRSYLRLLELIASLSPLLGLLGTVLGMIEAFQKLEQAGSRIDPALLSGGIWQALLTTAIGLAVAIPVVLVLSWLERRVERCAHTMEDFVTQVFTRPVPPVPDPAHAV
jgi:biopolymer transport protein ExbB